MVRLDPQRVKARARGLHLVTCEFDVDDAYRTARRAWFKVAAGGAEGYATDFLVWVRANYLIHRLARAKESAQRNVCRRALAEIDWVATC